MFVCMFVCLSTGKEVRYIIDYYHDESGIIADRRPGLTDVDAMKSIKVEVRPVSSSYHYIIIWDGDRYCN